jgi:hypothetical protein
MRITRAHGVPARARAAGALVGPVAVLALVAGCASPVTPSTPVPSPAQTATSADCLAPQVIADLGIRTDARELSATPHPDVPAPGAVPAGFEAVSVVECVGGERLTDTDGVWDGVAVRRLEGDLGPLLAALARASAAPEGSPTCVPSGAAPSELWLVDALGRAIRPVQPLDGCGEPTQAVRKAVAALKEIEVASYRVHLVDPRASAAPSTG